MFCFVSLSAPVVRHFFCFVLLLLLLTSLLIDGVCVCVFLGVWACECVSTEGPKVKRVLCPRNDDGNRTKYWNYSASLKCLFASCCSLGCILHLQNSSARVNDFFVSLFLRFIVKASIRSDDASLSVSLCFCLTIIVCLFFSLAWQRRVALRSPSIVSMTNNRLFYVTALREVSPGADVCVCVETWTLTVLTSFRGIKHLNSTVQFHNTCFLLQFII